MSCQLQLLVASDACGHNKRNLELLWHSTGFSHAPASTLLHILRPICLRLLKRCSVAKRGRCKLELGGQWCEAQASCTNSLRQKMHKHKNETDDRQIAWVANANTETEGISCLEQVREADAHGLVPLETGCDVFGQCCPLLGRSFEGSASRAGCWRATEVNCIAASRQAVLIPV